jgi:hypothetical protein
MGSILCTSSSTVHCASSGPQHPLASLLTITGISSNEVNSDSSSTAAATTAATAMTRQQKFVIAVASSMVTLWILKDPPG